MKELQKRHNKWGRLLVMLVGTAIVAAGVKLVFEPMNMVTGGVSGLAIILKNLTKGIIKGGISVEFTTTLVNIPLLLVAWKVKGLDFLKNTILATVAFTFALYIIPSYNIANHDNLLASVVGGVLTGTGLGMVFQNGGSTGGTDLLGAILNHYFPNFSVADMLLFADSAIIMLGALIFGLNSALYAVIAVYVTTKVMDSILEGMKFAKLAYIISDHPDEMSKHVMNTLGRGATFIEAQGGYTMETKRMLMCVVSNKQIVKLKKCVAEIDPESFLVIADAREVLGQGFIEIDY